MSLAPTHDLQKQLLLEFAQHSSQHFEAKGCHWRLAWGHREEGRSCSKHGCLGSAGYPCLHFAGALGSTESLWSQALWTSGWNCARRHQGLFQTLLGFDLASLPAPWSYLAQTLLPALQPLLHTSLAEWTLEGNQIGMWLKSSWLQHDTELQEYTLNSNGCSFISLLISL